MSVGLSDTARVDLHTHTNYSDGHLSPAELVEKAQRAGLAALAVTDHDNVDAWAEASEAASRLGICLISGVELSTSVQGQDVHLLGYWFDPAHAGLRSYLDHFRNVRRTRAEAIVDRLHDLGIPLRFETVLANAGEGTIGRPHIAQALMSEGYTESYREAFQNYIGNSAPAYVDKPTEPPEAVIQLVKEAGGVSVLAHPGWFTYDSVIMRLIRAGLDGIEIVHPAHDAQLMQYYQQIAKDFFLLETGGSDYHGHREEEESNFGYYVAYGRHVKAIVARLAG